VLVCDAVVTAGVGELFDGGGSLSFWVRSSGDCGESAYCLGVISDDEELV